MKFFDKIKTMFSNSKKKISAIVASSFAFAVMAIGSFAAEGDLTSSITSITGALGDFSSGNVTSVIVAGLGIAVPLVLVWFAFRWIYKKAKGGLKRGS